MLQVPNEEWNATMSSDELSRQDAERLVESQLEEGYFHLIQEEHIEEVIRLRGCFRVEVRLESYQEEVTEEGPPMETSELAPPGPYLYPCTVERTRKVLVVIPSLD